jgi:hypothetical protein
MLLPYPCCGFMVPSPSHGYDGDAGKDAPADLGNVALDGANPRAGRHRAEDEGGGAKPEELERGEPDAVPERAVFGGGRAPERVRDEDIAGRRRCGS